MIFLDRDVPSSGGVGQFEAPPGLDSEQSTDGPSGSDRVGRSDAELAALRRVPVAMGAERPESHETL